MFVEIIKKENNSPIGMDTLFKKQREVGITPEFAMEVLRSTNHYGNIKQVARHILSLETLEERLAYKDFVVGAVDRRETTPDAFKMLYGLACEGGYDVEFFKAYNEPKEYSSDYCNFKTLNVLCKSKHDELPQDVREYDRVVLDYSEYTSGRANPSIEFACKECCFKNGYIINVEQGSKYIGGEKFRFDNVEGVDFSAGPTTNFVEFVDCKSASFGASGSFDGDKDAEKEINLTARNVDTLTISKKYYTIVKHVKCDFDNVANLSVYGMDLENIDLENIKGVEYIFFSGCYNFSEKLEQIKGVKRICFFECSGYPENLDLSAFDEVSLICTGYSDINELKGIKFKEGATVCISPASWDDPDGYGPITYHDIKIPPHIDFSKCSELTLGGSFAQYDTLSFGEGAKVNFSNVQKFPAVLDVSMCGEVVFERLNADVNQIIFKDMAQLEDVAKKSRKDEKEQKLFLSTLKKKAKFVNKEKSSGFLSKIWERGG